MLSINKSYERGKEGAEEGQKGDKNGPSGGGRQPPPWARAWVLFSGSWQPMLCLDYPPCPSRGEQPPIILPRTSCDICGVSPGG